MARMSNRISLYEAIQKKQRQLGKGLKPAAPNQPPLEPRVQAPVSKLVLPQPKPQMPPEKTQKPGQKRPEPQAAQIRPAKLKFAQASETARQTIIKGLKKPLAGSAMKLKKAQSALSAFWKGLFEDISWLWWAGITAGLLILLVLVFILGMEYQRGGKTLQTAESEPVQLKVVNAGKTVKTAPADTAGETEAVKQPVKKQPQRVMTAEKTGTNAIVIAAYTKKDDLTPVQEYFKKNRIDTEVIQRAGYYLLLTKEWFDNPEKEGTDGYRIKELIKKLGAEYKAPDGYERFGTTPFQDVYGMKMK